MAIGIFLDSLGLKRLAEHYRSFFNKVSRHFTSESIEQWTIRLNKAGFKVEKAWDIIPVTTFRIIEIGHYLGVPSWIFRNTFGVWNIVRNRANFALLMGWLEKYYVEPAPQPDGVYSFYITRKR